MNIAAAMAMTAKRKYLVVSGIEVLVGLFV